MAKGQSRVISRLCPIVGAGLMRPLPCGYTMSDWKSLIDQAMMQEGTNTIEAHRTYGLAVRTALSNAQLLLTDLEAAQIIESIYGALVAYSQQVMLRMKAEDPEVGGVDHAFRTGQAYGVSCVLNHLIDQLTDVASITSLEALDDFSDTLHNDILVQARAAGLTVELLDAKGDILLD